jgi:hypothetical protein
MTTINAAQLARIADRYVSLLERFDALEGVDSRYLKALRVNTKLALLDWHEREPLNFDVLERFPDVDFTHDLGGILRGDTLMSARSALVYHPNPISDAEA